MSDSTQAGTRTDSAGRQDPGGPEKYMSIGEVLHQLEGDFHVVEPHRAPSGYRKFVAADVERLRWILLMQRDHFLPLRVIKERLDSGVELDQLDSGPVEQTPKADAPTKPKKARGSRLTAAPAGGDGLNATDFARKAGLSAPQLDDLMRFGLIDQTGAGDGFSSEELAVAKAAATFLKHGIEARHLKAWRVAAEREAGMLEQIVMPLTRKGSKASDEAQQVAEELVEMGNVIREAIIVKALRDRLDFGGE